MPNTSAWATARKTCTLTTGSVSGCQECSSWPTETKLWKRRSHTPSRASFRLVENAVNDFRKINFLRHNHVLPQTNGAEFQVLLHLCPVLRTWETCLSWFYSTKIINSSQFKSQDDFNTVKWRNKAVKVEFRCTILSIKKAMVHSTSIIFFNLFTAKW